MECSRSFWQQILGYLVSIPLGLVNFSGIGSTDLFTIPKLTFPNFGSEFTISVIFGVGVMAIATIPESTAHLYQISLYVDHLAEEMGREKLGFSKLIGLNLMLDGLNDLINGIFGSTAGTNYGENNSLMVITRNYSGTVLITAGVIASDPWLHRTSQRHHLIASRLPSPVAWPSTCLVSLACRVLH